MRLAHDMKHLSVIVTWMEGLSITGLPPLAPAERCQYPCIDMAEKNELRFWFKEATQ